MRGIGAAAFAVLLAGCTTVKLAQRDGCWIRQTSKFMGSTKEEIGPCTRADPAWVQDRYTRLVQECVAQADHRWMTLALASWERHESMPAQPAADSVLERCMNEASTAMVAENEGLKQQLGEAATQRNELAKRYEADHGHLISTNDKLAEFLGDAAKKPGAPATATASATSDGKATSENGSQMRSASDTSFSGTTGSNSSSVPGEGRGATGKAHRPLRSQPLGRAASQKDCAPSAADDGAANAPVKGGTTSGGAEVKRVRASGSAAGADEVKPADATVGAAKRE